MRKKFGMMMAALEALIAGRGDERALTIYDKTPLVQMHNVTIASNPANFGLYRAGARAHKRYLRKNHLGKFRKRK